MDVNLNGGISDTRGFYRIDAVHTVAGTPTVSGGQTTIAEAGTSAKVGDIFRAETGPLQYQEIPVTAVTTNSFTIASSVAPGTGNTFYLLRRVTSRQNTDGSIVASVSSGPVQFTLNGIDTTVKQDTGTPANSRALPVRQFNADGTSVDGATAALQTAGNASLTTIATNSGTQATAANQATGNASLATIATNSGTQATAANQATEIASLATIATNSGTQATAANQATEIGLLGSLTETAPASDVASSGLNGRLQRIAQRITSLIALLPASIGQKNMAGSLAVTFASDQTALPVTTNTTDVTATGAITIINSVPAGVATAGSAVASGALNGAATASVQVTGTYTGALSLQYTVDGTNWITAGGIPFLNVATGAMSATIPSATQGIFQFEATGMAQYRITALAAVTGTATVTLRTSRATNMMTLDAPLPVGTNSIGNLGTVATVTAVTTITNPVTANQAAAAAKTVKSNVITVGITAVRATTDAAAVTAGRAVLKVRPSDANTGVVYIGPSTVTTANGFKLFPGESMEFNFDAGDYYLISDTAAQSAFILEQE